MQSYRLSRAIEPSGFVTGADVIALLHYHSAVLYFLRIVGIGRPVVSESSSPSPHQ